MFSSRRRLALLTILSSLFAVPTLMAFQAPSVVEAEPPLAVVDPDGRFPERVETKIAGRLETLRLTGTAVRKKLRIAFYRIAAYCDTDVSPADVDALAAADAPKRLILVMERNIADWLLRRSFEEAFAANDPESRFTKESALVLDHITARPLVKGDYVMLTHLPRQGFECCVSGGKSLTIPNCDFAHMVWNVYMGPKACSPDLRAGLGTELAND